MKNRQGFTLLELLVVIAIISILSLIVLQAVGGSISMAREAKTKSILYRLKVQMQHKSEGLDRYVRRTPNFVDSTPEMAFLNTKGSPWVNLPLNTKRLLAKKLMLGHYFPQDPSEMWDLALYPAENVGDVLLNIPMGFWAPDDDMPMIDAWGNQIVFLRWPTALFQAHPEFLGSVYNKDPDDPLNQLSGIFAAGQQFDPKMPILMPDPCKPYVMVLVSPGPDGKLGFSMPLGAVTSEQDLSDNLWSFQR